MVRRNLALYQNLRIGGYKLIYKPTLVIKKKGKIITKGNKDAELVLHCMIEYPHYDKAIIISGDGDFYCLVEYLQKQHKLERILIPNKYSFSYLFWKFKEDMDYVNRLRNKIEYKNRGVALRTKP